MSDSRIEEVATTYGKSSDDIKSLSIFDVWGNIAVQIDNGQVIKASEIKDVYVEASW